MKVFVAIPSEAALAEKRSEVSRSIQEFSELSDHRHDFSFSILPGVDDRRHGALITEGMLASLASVVNGTEPVALLSGRYPGLCASRVASFCEDHQHSGAPLSVSYRPADETLSFLTIPIYKLPVGHFLSDSTPVVIRPLAKKVDFFRVLATDPSMMSWDTGWLDLNSFENCGEQTLFLHGAKEIIRCRLEIRSSDGHGRKVIWRPDRPFIRTVMNLGVETALNQHRQCIRPGRYPFWTVDAVRGKAYTLPTHAPIHGRQDSEFCNEFIDALVISDLSSLIKLHRRETIAIRGMALTPSESIRVTTLLDGLKFQSMHRDPKEARELSYAHRD